jgi:Flp pilus assembly protein TadD
LVQARSLRSQERWIEAADQYMQITEVHPENGEAWFNLGYCLHIAGEMDLAINAHRKAATFEQFTGIALFNLGCAHALLGEPDEAFEALEASYEAGFDIGQRLYSDSDLASLQDDERFATLYEKTAPDGPEQIITRGRDSALAMVQQARQYLSQHGPAMMEQAKAMAQQAAGLAHSKYQEFQELAGDDERINEIRAHLHETFARAHEAFLQWRQRHESDRVSNGQNAPGDETPNPEQTIDTATAQELFQQAQWSEAADAYRVALEAEPDDGLSWFQFGYALLADGQIEEAIVANRRAATFEAYKGIALYNIACAHSLLDDSDAAFEALDACRLAGFDRLPNLDDDPDFDNIRDDPRFAAFIASLSNDRTSP